MITKFTILGERCSGTNFLEHAIKTNFVLDISWEYGWKHFFGFNKLENSDNTLFIGIVRDPHIWMDSMYNKKIHLQPGLLKNIDSFLNERFWSCNDKYSVSKDNTEIMQDRHIYTGERYKNIFECRKIKLNYLFNDMPNKVKNYILIRYEDLRDDYENTLEKLRNKFNLKTSNQYITPIIKYKGTYHKYIENKNYKLNKDMIYEHPDFDKSIEEQLGYI